MSKYCVVDLGFDLSQVGYCTCDVCVERFTHDYQDSMDEIVGQHVDLIRGSDKGTYLTLNRNAEEISAEVWQEAHDRTDVEPHQEGDTIQ